MANTRIVLNRQSDLILDNAQITSPVGIVVADIDGLQSVVTSIDTNVSEVMSTEVSNRIAGDESVATAMVAADSAEASMRIAGDGSLETALANEVSSRIADVDAEESRAIVAETSLQNNIEAEASLRVVGDESLEDAMDAADQSLAADLSTETSRALVAEASLNTKVDFVISNTDPAALDSLTEIVGAFQSADGDLNGAITSLATAATLAVDNEASIRLAADESLESDLSSEIVDRTAAVSMEEAARISGDASVVADLSMEEAARISGDNSLETAMNDADNSLETAMNNADSSLETAMNDADASLATSITAEESRAISAEGSLSTVIANADSTEASIRLAADESLATALSAEASDRIADVNAEESRAMSVEASLESALTAAISDEHQHHVDGDASVTTAFEAADSAEASMRVAGDESVMTELSTEIVNREDAVSAEASMRVAGDTSLASAIATEASRIDVILDGSTVDLDQFAEIVEFVNGIDLENDNALLSAVTSIGDTIGAEESRAMSVEAVLSADLSTEISDRVADVDAEESRAMSAEDSLATAITDGDASIAADLSTEIDALADPDGVTIELDGATNTIRLMETVAAPDSGLRTFEGDIEVNGVLTVGGVDVMAEISSEIARAESAESSLSTELSTQVSYLISNIDVTEIDSFSEIVENLSTEVSRAESAELSLANDFANIYFRNAGVVETADGVTTEFTFGATLRAGSQAVYLNGLLQDAGDYTITTTSVTFNDAPLTGDKIAVYGMY